MFQKIKTLCLILGSQAVSSTNLTNDDTLSIRSMSVDDTPDFDKAMDYTHITRTKHSMAGLRNEITELRNDINDLKNDIVESKNELDDTTFEKAKTPITPGAKRINPFLRDCEEVSKGTDQLVDPLGAIPIESVMTVSSQSNKSEIHHVNGDASHENYIGEFFVDLTFTFLTNTYRYVVCYVICCKLCYVMLSDGYTS